MSKANYHQSSFLGGEWAPLAQGRNDVPAYKMAMNVCMNNIIAEEGACLRRSGFEWLTTTRGGNPAKLIPWTPDTANPYVLEFTNTYLRIFSGTSPLFTANRPTITASSVSGGALSLTVSSVTGLNIGDDILLFAPTGVDYANIGPWRGRTLNITNIVGSVLTLGDYLGNATLPSVSANTLVNCQVFQIFHITTVFSGTLDHLRLITCAPANTVIPVGVIISGDQKPYTLTNLTLPSGDTDATFSLAATTFIDGPYLDPQGTIQTPETGTVSAFSGSITFTPASSSFTASDVGRQIRLFSEPPAWASGTTYTYGQQVKFNNSYWTFIYSSGLAGAQPGALTTISGVQYFVWAPSPTAAQWAWGTITAQAGASCTVSLTTSLPTTNGTTVTQWRLGVFKSGQFPQAGLWHEGRLWLGGALPNRFDASVSNGMNSDGSIVFSPTDIYNNVLDTSGISEVLNADDDNNIMWFSPDHQGILTGTLTGEWLIQASAVGDPITPSSIQAHKVTKYGCFFANPVRAGMALVFIQRYQRRLLEYLADAFTQRYTGRHINEFAKHLTTAGIAELAYQEETVPIIWCRMADGSLAGVSYRRVSRFVTEAPVFQAWHRHVLGGDYAGDLQRLVKSICVQTAKDLNLSDQVYVCTGDTGATQQQHFVELLRPLLEDV